MNPRDKPYLQEAGYLGGSQEEESLKFAWITNSIILPLPAFN